MIWIKTKTKIKISKNIIITNKKMKDSGDGFPLMKKKLRPSVKKL